MTDKTTEKTAEKTAEKPRKTRKPKLSVVEQLSQPFDETIVGKRQIVDYNGNIIELDYIPGRYVIERLNEVLGLNWSFEIKQHLVDTGIMQVAVLGRLTVFENGNIIKSAEQWGGTYITRTIKGTVTALGDDLKIAGTDALKKCATQLGVALYLYDNKENTVVGNVLSGEPSEKQIESIRKAVDATQENDERPSKTESPVEQKPVEQKKEEIDGQNPITEAQVKAIRNLCSYKQVDHNAMLAALNIKNFGDLSYADAASILTLKHPVWDKFCNRNQ